MTTLIDNIKDIIYYSPILTYSVMWFLGWLYLYKQREVEGIVSRFVVSAIVGFMFLGGLTIYLDFMKTLPIFTTILTLAVIGCEISGRKLSS